MTVFGFDLTPTVVGVATGWAAMAGIVGWQEVAHRGDDSEPPIMLPRLYPDRRPK